MKAPISQQGQSLGLLTLPVWWLLGLVTPVAEIVVLPTHFSCEQYDTENQDLVLRKRVRSNCLIPGCVYIT
jgi:hypothetical protein